MNRRYFLTAAGAAVMAIMAGCGQSESKFVGYWKYPSEAQTDQLPVVLLHIRLNGDSFFLTFTSWEGPKKGYETKDVAATLGASSNMLNILGGLRTISYDEATDQLLLFVDGEKVAFAQITKDNYQAALDRGKAEYEREKAKQKETQKAN